MIDPRSFVLASIVAAAGCNCGDVGLVAQQDVPPPPCGLGKVTGRACAPDAHTWIGGASVTATGTDCAGGTFTMHATTADDGTFTLSDIPSGHRQLDVVSGSFTRSYDVSVTAGKTTAIPDDQLCFKHDAARIAVVSAHGDHIETLLAGLGLTVDLTVDGSSSGWSTKAKPFLLDLQALKREDVLFIDCAAAESQSQISLGNAADTATIMTNLRAFVAGGGSVYASDWAFLFIALAWPAELKILDPSGVARSPFPTHELDGFAPQTVNARVADAGLAAALGKDTVTVAFPNQSGAASLHWGLLEDAPAGVTSLIEGTAQTCADATCHTPGSPAVNIPLAITFTPQPDDPAHQGRVTYTSFHNIAQPTGDVEAILRYLVFHL